MSSNQYVVILNGMVYGSYKTEDDAIRIGDWLFKQNPRSTITVKFGDDVLMELKPQ